MATRRLAGAFGGTAYIDLTIDVPNRMLTAITGRNATINAGRASGDGPRYTRSFGDTEGTVNVPTTAANRIQLAVHRTGWDGLDIAIELIGPSQRS